MTDKNNIEIKTGMIVKIEGGYFKADNGTFLVKHSPGDSGWSGKDYSLRKCNKKGEESTAKYATAFYPLMITVNNSDTRRIAREHNKNHATIEVIGEVKTYKVSVKQFIWGNEHEFEEIATEKRYQELLSIPRCEVTIL